MATGPRAAIPAPPNRQPRTGLIPLANRPTDVPDDWENGFAFAPEACGPGQALEYDCGPTGQKEPPENPDVVSVDPVLILGGDRCSTLDNDRDATERAERHLRAIESRQLEQVLWTGQTTSDPETDLPRPHLADGNGTNLNDGNPVQPVHALSLLDQALTACLHGVQGMVHVTPYLLVWLSHTDGLLVRENGRWLTPNGHLVVAGSGYTGGGPRPTPDQPLPAAPDLLSQPPANQWAYGTGMVDVLLGPAETLSDVDRSINTRTVLRERPAAAYWGCCHFAVQIDFP